MLIHGQCYYCGWSGGKHDPACPEVVPNPENAKKLWRQGWDDGRAGGKNQPRILLINLGTATAM